MKELPLQEVGVLATLAELGLFTPILAKDKTICMFGRGHSIFPSYHLAKAGMNCLIQELQKLEAEMK